jgi:predicted ribosomally synthesized peptide with nif11-like leader
VSSEAAVAFVERIKSDETFQTKLADAPGPAERLAIAREEGFDVSADDLGAIRRTLGVEELSDEELERVAGGMSTTTAATIIAGSATAGVVAGEVAAAFI